MAVTPPTRVSYTEPASWTTGGSPKATASTVSWQTGDVVVVIAGSDGTQNDNFGTPSVTNLTGTGLTFSDKVDHQSNSDCAALLSIATAAGNGSGNISVSLAGDSSGHWGFGVWVWRGSTGNNWTTQVTSQFSSTRTKAYTVAQADSAICWGVFDWAAENPLQTITPTPTNTDERTRLAGQYDAYAADLTDQSNTGSVSYGITNTGSGPFSIVIVEIRGTASATAYTLSAAAGSYALTGTAATLKCTRKVTADAGTYTWTGTDAALKRGYPLTAEAGTYTLTGSAVGLRATRKLSAGAGSYSWTGTATGLLRGYPMTASPG